MLRDRDGRWCVVDPVLRRGDAERTAVNVLWHRVDEMADHEIPRWFDVLVEAAGLDAGLARAWARWRVTDYWVWGWRTVSPRTRPAAPGSSRPCREPALR